MTSLNSSRSAAALLQIQQLKESNNQLNQQVQQLTDQISIKRWESVRAKAAATVVLIMGTGAFMKFFMLDPMSSRLDQQKDEITRLEKQVTTKEKVGGVQKSTSEQNQNGQIDLLSILSINRVFYDPVAKSVTSALVLSKSARDQLKKFPVKMVTLKIEFQPGQDSVEFWIFDERQNYHSQKLLKEKGVQNSENRNERYFEIADGGFPTLDPTSILEIRIEARGLKKNKESDPVFAIKSLVMK